MYRKAVLSDSNAICGLVCGQEGLELSREKFYDILNEQLQDRQHYYCLVYEENSRIEGVLNLRIERQLRYAGPVAEITEFFVAPDHRNQGIGTGLFEQALELAQKKASAMAEKAGTSIKGIVSITEHTPNNNARYSASGSYMEYGAADGAVAEAKSLNVTILPGTVEAEASVNVVYEIK